MSENVSHTVGISGASFISPKCQRISIKSRRTTPLGSLGVKMGESRDTISREPAEVPQVEGGREELVVYYESIKRELES